MRRTLFAIIASASLFGLAGVASASEVYQWKDANGVTHYSQTPPPKGQYQQRQITNRGATAPAQAGATAAAPATGGNRECTAARTNVETLKRNQPVHEVGEDGKPGRALSDGERASQLELANAAVKAYCTPAAGSSGT